VLPVGRNIGMEPGAVMRAGTSWRSSAQGGRCPADDADVGRSVRVWFGDMRIGTKIFGASLAISAIFAAVTVVGQIGVRDIAAQQEREYRVNVIALAHVAGVRSAIGSQQEAVLSFVLADPDSDRESYIRIVTDADSLMSEDFNALDKLALPKAASDGLRSIESDISLWRTSRDNALKVAAAGGGRQGVLFVVARLNTIAGAAKRDVDDLLNQFVSSVTASARNVRNSSLGIARLMLILGIAGIAVALFLSWLVVRSISRPLAEVVDVLARVSRGDLTHKVQFERRDEVGQMGASLNDTLTVLGRTFDEVNHRASHDGLTGLANRTLLQERLNEADQSVHNGGSAAVFLIDVDDFKRVNDTYGHAGGDQLLILIAARMRAVFRESDTVARIGGDEFAIVLTGVDKHEDVSAVADKLIGALHQPADLDGTSFLPSVSVGTAMWQPGQTMNDVVLGADAALYAAKGDGKGRIILYDPTIRPPDRDEVPAVTVTTGGASGLKETKNSAARFSPQ
jgi:diguanylate cyclase (GGDEF)-like protein